MTSLPLPVIRHFLVDCAIKNTTFSWFTRELEFSQIWRMRQRVDRVLVHIHVESRQKLWSSFWHSQIAAIRRSLTNFSPHYHYVQLNVIIKMTSNISLHSIPITAIIIIEWNYLFRTKNVSVIELNSRNHITHNPL